jgi:hypothetical protein
MQIPSPTALLLLLLGLASAAQGMDTGYSNEQAGVRFRIIGLDTEAPYMRIENRKSSTLAIRNSFVFAVTFKRDGVKVRRAPATNPFEGNGLRHVGSPNITVLEPGANLELPMYEIYFNYAEDGYGETESWKTGVQRMPPGKYQVCITSNGGGISVLDVNWSPFKVNFDIPAFEYEVK